VKFITGILIDIIKNKINLTSTNGMDI